MSDTVDIQLKRTVPIMRAVAAAIIDSHEDIGKKEELFTHWAVRGFKKLNQEVLQRGIRRIILNVNPNTRTATLPLDFHEETFIGPIINGKKFGLRLRNDLIPFNTEEEVCEDKCPICSQDKAICNDLTVTETTELVAVGDTLATKTTVKRLYPNGDYMLEITFPVMNLGTNEIEYMTTKEKVTAFDMKECGCLDLTDETVQKIECFCPDAFCQHFTPCACNCTDDYGGYKIFEESGLIQFDTIGKFKKVYMEYRGFLPKKHGQYYIPEVSFETIVEWTKYKNIDGRKNVPEWRIERQWQSYQRERGNMEKILFRLDLAVIINAILQTPKFDRIDPVWECCFTAKPVETGGDTTHEICEPTVCQIPAASSSALIAGSSIDRVQWDLTGGELSLSDPKLKGKRLLYFNIENNDSWKFIFSGTPTFRQIKFDSVLGTITMPFAGEANQFAFAIFASGLTDAAPNGQLTNTIIIPWNITADNTTITNPTSYNLVSGQLVVISVTPNGFTYNWDTMFKFTDTLPEQPGAIAAGTTQLYTFLYVGGELVIQSESLKIFP